MYAWYALYHFSRSIRGCGMQAHYLTCVIFVPFEAVTTASPFLSDRNMATFLLPSRQFISSLSSNNFVEIRCRFHQQLFVRRFLMYRLINIFVFTFLCFCYIQRCSAPALTLVALVLDQLYCRQLQISLCAQTI